VSSWIDVSKRGQTCKKQDLTLGIAAALAALILATPDAQFRSSVSSVAVYATVADGSGRLVTDLTRDDFTIRDNGRPVDISLFSNDPQPITVAVMLDMSGSMVSRFTRVRSSTIEFIEAMLPTDRAQIGTFGDEVSVSPMLTSDKAILTRVLRQELWPGGATPLWNALDAGMTALERETGRRVVLTLTDGGDSCIFRRCLSFGDVQKRAVREGFMIYAIGMEKPGLATEIVELSEETGGGHYEIKADDDLTSTFVQISDELRRQYLLGFAPLEFDGKLHKLEVGLKREGLTVRARKNYLSETRK
jgi:Ca-activated chloride channel family protein